MQTNVFCRTHFITLLAICFSFRSLVQSAEIDESGILSYTFDPNPQEIKPKLYNWEVRLSASDSTNGAYEIIQVSQPVGGGATPATTNVLIGVSQMSHKEMIVTNGSGKIDFMLHVGDKEPTRNMNGQGNLGLPLIFSGKGTGKGESDWIVVPGYKIDRVIPSEKGTQMVEGKLRLIQFVVSNTQGENIQAEVILRRR